MASLQTPLCQMLNIETPIVQAPIGQATNPAMAAAVSNAGGLGMLAFLRRDADDVRRLISETHELTDRPFGANFILRGLPGTDDRVNACLESRNVKFCFLHAAKSAGMRVVPTGSLSTWM